MARESPLRKSHEAAGAAMIPWGPVPESVAPSDRPSDEAPAADASGRPVQVVETFGEIGAEYAAIRKGCILLDQPHRATLTLTGDDHLPFLNRMLTQELKDLPVRRCVRSFWLNRKGRIDADLRVIRLEGRTLLDLDVHAAQRAVATLDAFIIADDVTITDDTDAMHRLSLHGPAAPALLAAAGAQVVAGPAPEALAPGDAAELTISGAPVVADRQDSTGEPGFELLMAAGDAPAVYSSLLEAAVTNFRGRGREAGWHAYNIARIEAGWPVYYLDFGPDSLPHETGVLRDRVSFKKGCFLGQEVVARMESLGKPKQRLVGLRVERVEARPDAASPTPRPIQPITGDPVFPAGGDADKPVGAVTSSTLSPMLGDIPVCFAMVREQHTAPGTPLEVIAEGRRLSAAVQDSLTFWRKT